MTYFHIRMEQRFNAINPQAAKKKQKIYSFEIVNRETFELRLLNSKGQPISNTLAYPDLFSFDVEKDTDIRSNFENAFNRYESNVKTHTESLIYKLTTGQKNMDVNEEVVNLFTAKLLNFTPPVYLENYKNAYKKLPRSIQLNYCVDNMELLGGFNRNVVYQSYRHVFCASKPPFIL